MIHCDSASNFIPLSKLEASTANETAQEPENNRQSIKTLNSLKRVLQRNYLALKVLSPKASWRNSLAESMVKKFKGAKIKFGLYSTPMTICGVKNSFHLEFKATQYLVF